MPTAISGLWTKDIEKKGIFLSDKEACLTDSASSVHLLIGADIAGKLFTIKIMNLSCGLVALQTLLGWSLRRKLENEVKNDSYMTVLSLHVNNKSISDLWSLDTLGILDTADKQSQMEIEKETEKLFLNSVKQNGYVDRIKILVILRDYENVFEDSKKEGIVEELNSEDLKDSKCHYLRHRPVIKDNSTTRIRPVFDGSAKFKGSSSLNDSLVTGPNLVELIPSLINRFRIGKYGVIADIRKAFLQIRLNDSDKDYLRFLSWQDGDPNLVKIYRHCRALFGIKSSPFLLRATLNHLLDGTPDCYKMTAQHLQKSMYVNSCVASVKNKADLTKFINESREIMALGKFDLRGGQHNSFESLRDNCNESQDLTILQDVAVLGLLWNIERDTLKIDVRTGTQSESVKVTEIYSLKMSQNI
ncbi:reverse transcriptase [Caerostris darwini]|uniref:Reverse transcriptase n=1 Tax=Caerostris darwini TaxID=1538125 RepID=A0AAV4N5Q8_9ARAC|nr:reverse transcriptase [Caerostris darwini]